ncbi:MAG: hypothetical protein RQ885_03965 [Desulfurococcales archaeon]|jgi:putative transposase|nr:hypothetical protein [Desulfurococcales archaeon]
MLSQDNGNEYNTNIWWFRKIVLWIADIFMEYGIDVEIVPEDYLARDAQYVGRNTRREGYIEGCIYEKTGRKINADINVALNIARKLGYRIRMLGR